MTARTNFFKNQFEIHRDELYAEWQLAVECETVFKIKGLELNNENNHNYSC